MALSHTYTNRVTVPGIPALPADPPLVVSGNSGEEFEQTVGPNSTTTITVGTITAANIVSLVFNSTISSCVANTNTATGATGNSITLTSGSSFVWSNMVNTTSFPNPITSNITKFFLINNSSTSTSTFRIGILSNN